MADIDVEAVLSNLSDSEKVSLLAGSATFMYATQLESR